MFSSFIKMFYVKTNTKIYVHAVCSSVKAYKQMLQLAARSKTDFMYNKLIFLYFQKLNTLILCHNETKTVP